MNFTPEDRARLRERLHNGGLGQDPDEVIDLLDDIDALSAQLASMTKRAEDAERELESSETTRLVQAQAAEAKLATAVETLKDVLALHGHPRIADSMNRFYEWRLLISQIRALGIDTSKETGK